MEISEHAQERIKERLNIGKKSQERLLRLALEKGHTQHRIKGRLKKWADNLAIKHKTSPIIYGNHCYFVNRKKNVLITVIPIPKNLLKDLKKMIKN